MLSVILSSSLFALVLALQPSVVSNYNQLATAVSQSTHIILKDLYIPGNKSLDLSKLKSNTTITFTGRTTFGFTNSSSFRPIIFGGKNILITATDDSIIDGNGPAYWDGLGSNGGLPKFALSHLSSSIQITNTFLSSFRPNDFITVKLANNSIISNLTIRNWPSHLFSISSSSSLTLCNLLLDNHLGDTPNNRSGTLAAVHNIDAFDISNSSDLLLQNITVYNQDDCVAITSGNNITVSHTSCTGSHGLSIGSIGGKSNNNVTNILFTDSTLINSSYGPRVKTNFGTTGYVANISYTNIRLENITAAGVDVQQDYLNGGPTGVPSNGVVVEGVRFVNITGYVAAGAREWYILCGEGSCKDFTWEGQDIRGGKNGSCNLEAGICP